MLNWKNVTFITCMPFVGSNGLNIAGNKFDAYKCDANEAIQFRISKYSTPDILVP